MAAWQARDHRRRLHDVPERGRTGGCEVAILLAIGRGATRFTEIRAQADGISTRLLSARLRSLESRGLVVREVIPSHPVQIKYTLSQSGSEVVRVLIPLAPWGSRWGITAD